MKSSPERLAPNGASLNPRRNNFGFLRILLASLVVISHSAELLDGDRSREILTRIFGTIAFGTLAVDGFFVISGFLIVKSWVSRPSPLTFLAKRALRIYPGFIVASLVSVFLVGRLAAVVHVESHDLLTLTLRNIVRLYETDYPAALKFVHSQRLNGSLWTIRWEFYCYLLAMAFGVLGLTRRRWPWFVVLGIAAVFTVFPDMFVAVFPQKYNAAPRFLACFSSGALFYVYNKNIKYNKSLTCLAAVGLVSFLCNARLAELGIAIFGAYLIFAAAFAHAPSLACIGTKNDISYGVYLYAWPIQQLVILYAPSIPLTALMAISLALAYIAGYLSWRFIESPAIEAKKLLRGRGASLPLKAGGI